MAPGSRSRRQRWERPGAARRGSSVLCLGLPPGDELGGPLHQPIPVLGVVVRPGLADPPRGLIGPIQVGVPLHQHPGAGRMGLHPGHLPRLAAHLLQELGVHGVHVDVVPFVRARVQALEIGLRLGQPRAQVGDDVADRPVRIVVVARLQALGRGQLADRARDRVPACPFTEDRLAVRMLARNRRLGIGGGAHGWRAGAVAKNPSSGRPASSQSISPPA